MGLRSKYSAGMTRHAFIALGSNLNDRQAFLQGGLDALRAVPDIDVVSVSSIYETAPHGYTDQPAFLNAVCCAETDRSPQAVLAEMQRIELRFGRQRHIHWGPRTLDLDLLLMGDIRLNDSKLTLPHPHIGERDFVLVPLLQIAPELLNPDTGQSYAHDLATIVDRHMRPVAEFHM